MGNFEDAVDTAMKNGEKVVSIECPCCHKIFYAAESEAAYSTLNRNEETDFGMNLKELSGRLLGRKCPYCGFVGELAGSSFLNLGRDGLVQSEIDTEEAAIKINEKNQTSWSEICRPNL